MFRPITKAQNRKTIRVYYSLAVISISIGLITRHSTWYVVAVTLLGLGLFRKCVLMKRLKE